MEYNTFLKIIRGSKAYEMDGTVLELTGYYTGKRVRIDLAKITEEMFEEIAEESDSEDDDEDIYDDPDYLAEA